MDFESAIQTFAQAWMSAKASNSSQPPLQKSKSIDIPNRPDEYLNEEVRNKEKFTTPNYTFIKIITFLDIGE